MARYDYEILDQLDIALEDDIAAETSAEKRSRVLSRYVVSDHHATQTVHEMKELMRATADLLEMEAARLRHELESLDGTGHYATLH